MDHDQAADAQLRPGRPRLHQLPDAGSPSRWWFVSSAFPMIAGTLGPVASAFSICALARQWRQHLPPNTDLGQAVFIPDPPWLTIVNAAQLAMALVSNAFLLLNMAKRVRFTIAQPVTIVGWYISAICLLALVATAAGPLLEDLGQPLNEYMWSQAFYYGIWAAILYFVDATLMTATFWGASSGHYDKDFNLTSSQRTLMLQTIVVLMYLLLGALVFSTTEGWNYLDAVYWADVTLFTVGFGDFAASTTLGRILLFPYALVGVISLGLVVSSIRSLIVDRGRRRLDARMEEKKRLRTVRSLTLSGMDDILTPIQTEPVQGAGGAGQDSVSPDELERRRSEFELMRKIQEKASSRRRWMAMAVSTGSWLVLWLVGALVFFECERAQQAWTYFDAVYFCFVSLTTIGYGDRTPISNAGKSFFVFWSLLALPTMTVLISNAGDTVVKFIRDATLRLGNLTILPGDEGFTGEAKHMVHWFTRGDAFKGAIAQVVERDLQRRDCTSEKSASSTLTGKPRASNGDHGPSTLVPRREQPRRGDDGRHGHDDGRHGHDNSRHGYDNNRHGHDSRHGHDNRHGHHAAAGARDGRHSLSHIRNRLDALPTGHDFCLLLMSEIQVVSKHVREATPRRYSFEEWAWYLGLMGEDERDPGTHHKATSKSKHRHKAKHDHKHKQQQQQQQQQQRQPEALEPADEHAPPKWSWVGDRSPLAGGHEESEWILDRLMDRLNESLWKAKHGGDEEA